MPDNNYNQFLPSQQQLADDMLLFLEGTPLNASLSWTKDKDFLFHFEASRMLILRNSILEAGFTSESSFRMLDFGFLHGLTQEFIHRFFPKAKITVCDLPSSPNFKDQKYLEAIRSRGYLELVPCNINDLDESKPGYDVIMLGEIIEHLDPTQVAKALSKLRKVVKPGGLMMITTPNGAGLYNNAMIMLRHDLVLYPPIPDSVMGYPHIHLWPLTQLQPAAEHFGWKFKSVSYYHGREGEMFARSRRNWGSLRHQLLINAIKFLTNRYPALRGFYVASFTAVIITTMPSVLTRLHFLYVTR